MTVTFVYHIFCV